MNPKLVCLLTDFGCKDHYVAVMKARILRQCPGAALVDLTHQVSPQSISEGSYYLLQSVRHFPQGTVFLAVVDPGVGSGRKAIAVGAGDYFFVGPDNGLLSETVSSLGGLREAVEMETPAGSSHTFHGRDVFAPAAGRLAAGAFLPSLGTPFEQLVQLTPGTTIFHRNKLQVTILTIDHFGNVIFDLSNQPGWEPLQLGARFTIQGRRAVFTTTFSRVPPGDSLLLWNSSEHLELAVRNGNAAQVWGLKVGQLVSIECC